MYDRKKPHVIEGDVKQFKKRVLERLTYIQNKLEEYARCDVPISSFQQSHYNSTSHAVKTDIQEQIVILSGLLVLAEGEETDLASTYLVGLENTNLKALLSAALKEYKELYKHVITIIDDLKTIVSYAEIKTKKGIVDRRGTYNGAYSLYRSNWSTFLAEMFGYMNTSEMIHCDIQLSNGDKLVIPALKFKESDREKIKDILTKNQNIGHVLNFTLTTYGSKDHPFDCYRYEIKNVPDTDEPMINIKREIDDWEVTRNLCDKLLSYSGALQKVTKIGQVEGSYYKNYINDWCRCMIKLLAKTGLRYSGDYSKLYLQLERAYMLTRGNGSSYIASYKSKPLAYLKEWDVHGMPIFVNGVVTWSKKV